MKDIIVITIGRNESQRLAQALSAAQVAGVQAVIYVDSLSTDNSIEIAKKHTSHIVTMSSNDSPSAAHARNLGTNYVLKNFSDIRWVQFIDADCELVHDWLTTAVTYSKDKEKLGAVCGYRNEKHPNNSVYNLLSQMEWDRQVGAIESCGGDALVNIEALKDVKAFNANLIAGEEADFYGRMRLKNWEIHRIPHNMVLHDADMQKFSEWWKRAIRAGAAVALGLMYYPSNSRTYVNKQLRSLFFWTLILPSATLLLCIIFSTCWLLLFLLYPLLVFRITFRKKKDKTHLKDAFIYAIFTLIQKVPMSYGLFTAYIKHRRKIKNTLIEYK